MSDAPIVDHNTHKVEWIPVKNISVVWAAAQRPFDAKHAKEIADNFDPEQLDPIKVTLPNGNGIYHAIDGQHRVEAIKMAMGEDQRAPCFIVGDADPARAARLFVSTNTSHKRPQPLDLFKVRVTAEDDRAVGVDHIVRKLGYRIDSGPSDKSIMAVAALESIYRRYGPDVLEDALKVIQATWGMDRNAVVAPIIRGYGAFMGEHRHHANWQRLKDCIAKKYTPGKLIATAKTAREMSGGNVSDAIKGLLVGNYNRGLPTGKQLKAA